MQTEKGEGITESCLAVPPVYLPPSAAAACRRAPLFVIASLTPQFTCDKIITMLRETERETGVVERGGGVNGSAMRHATARLTEDNAG